MKNKVLATILFSLLVVPLVQSADNSPRLVVGITVDHCLLYTSDAADD